MNNETNQNYVEEISLKELILVLINEKKLIASITAISTIIAIIFTLMLPKTFEANSQIVFSIPSENKSRFGTFVFPSQNVSDYLPLLSSLELKNEVAQVLNLGSSNEVKLTFSFNEKNKYVEIKTQSSSPEFAKKLNDAVVDSYTNRINSQFKSIAIENFIHSFEMNISDLNFSIQKTQSMLIEKEAFLSELEPVYTLQKALFADPKAAALYANKFGLDLGSLSNDVVIEEFINDKYLALQAEVIDLKTSLIDMSQNLKFSNILLDELQKEKELFSEQVVALDYDNALNDELDVLNGAISQVHEAALPQAKISPRNSLNVAIGLILGFMIGIFAAFFKHYWKNTE